LFTAPWLAGAVPQPRGYVNDFAEVIEGATEQRLEERLRALEAETSAELVVATTDAVPNGDIERAAVDWFQAWGVGKRTRDNGALILCAVQDRAVRIEVGYGLEPVLPDAFCGRVIRDVMVPAFREGRFGDGLAAGAEAVAERIRAAAAGEPLPSESTEPPEWVVFAMLLAGFFIVVIAMSIAAARAERRAGSSHGRRRADDGDNGWGWGGGFGGGSSGGGGFGGGGGGFGGGSSGGGGASGRW
jgi:uncharacterized protein